MSFLYANLVLVLILVFVHVLLYPLEFLFLKTNLNSKNVVVTGSSMGIGRSVAFDFATKGAKNIVVVSRSESRLLQLKTDIESKFPATHVHVIASDLTQESNCVSLVERSVELMGSIDYLVLNHITDSHYGMWLSDNNDKKDHSFLKDLFQVNTFSYIWIATAAMEHLIKTNGHIAVVSSLAGHVGTPFTAAYSGSKHALHGFFNALRNELRIIGHNTVSITLCAIGATDTEGAAAKAKLTKIAWDPPEAAAAAIVNGSVMKVRDVYHPHHKVYPMVLISKLFPGLADYILRSAM